jgi:hypothetical protein
MLVLPVYVMVLTVLIQGTCSMQRWIRYQSKDKQKKVVELLRGQDQLGTTPVAIQARGNVKVGFGQLLLWAGGTRAVIESAQELTAEKVWTATEHCFSSMSEQRWSLTGFGPQKVEAWLSGYQLSDSPRQRIFMAIRTSVSMSI